MRLFAYWVSLPDAVGSLSPAIPVRVREANIDTGWERIGRFWSIVSGY